MTTAQERLDWLLETEFVPTNATITVAEIVDAVGDNAARLVTGTLQAGAAQDPLLSASWQAISTVGMSLSGADRQGMIDQLAAGGGWPDAVRDAVKELGGKIQPRWVREGYAAEPTLSQIKAEAATEAVRLWWVARSAVVEDGLFRGTITTQQQVRDILGAE